MAILIYVLRYKYFDIKRLFFFWLLVSVQFIQTNYGKFKNGGLILYSSNEI